MVFQVPDGFDRIVVRENTACQHPDWTDSGKAVCPLAKLMFCNHCLAWSGNAAEAKKILRRHKLEEINES